MTDSIFRPPNPFNTHAARLALRVDVNVVDPGTVIKERPGDEHGIAITRATSWCVRAACAVEFRRIG